MPPTQTDAATKATANTRQIAPPLAESSLQPQNAQIPNPAIHPRKRRASGEMASSAAGSSIATVPTSSNTAQTAQPPSAPAADPVQPPPAKKGRTNTPWTPAEELRLKQMRDGGNSWSEIAKTFPARTEGSVKKHWYKDMHYAEFAEDESAALLAAIKEYEANKWKAIGQKVGKPAKACEQYAKEHFGGKS